MKRIIVATLSTLVLSTLVAPGAKAIRPELLPEPVHPTISSEKATPSTPPQTSMELGQKPAIVPVQKANPETVQPQQSEEPPFEYFEEFYRKKYGT